MPAEVQSFRSRFLRYSPLTAGAVVGVALGWAQFRGFDLFDEATHLLTYQFPEDNPDTHTRYHLFARPFWLVCGGNIAVFRLLCLVLLSGAAWVFWRSWRRVLTLSEEVSLTLLAIVLSVLGGLGWLPVLLGYNSLSTFFALLAAAALVPALAIGEARQGSPAMRATWAAVFLALVALAAAVKPPAALALTCWGAFLALALLPWPRLWRLGAIVLVAAVAAGMLMLTARWVEQTTADPTAMINLAGIRLRPQWVLETLQRYFTELSAFAPALGRDLQWIVVPALALAVACFAGPWQPGKPAWRCWLVLVAFFGAILAVAIGRGLWDGSFRKAVSGEMTRFYLVLWASLLPAWIVVWGRAPRSHTGPGMLAAAFFILPVLCGLGSTNTLYFSALHWTVFWTAGLLIVARTVAEVLAAPWFQRLFTLLLILVAGTHLWSGHFLHPYMYQSPRWSQQVPVAIGHPATVLKLDETTARFLTEVRQVLDGHGYQPGDDVFGFFNLPGVTYAIGARSPGAPWYFGTWYHGDDTDGGKIRAVPPERRQRAWIITQADITPFRRELLNCDIDFPQAYEMIGQTINPSTGLEIRIWKFKAHF